MSSSSPQPVSGRKRKRKTVPDADRRRVHVACAACRRLKEKCDGEHPCSRCIRYGRQCNLEPAALQDRSSASDGSIEQKSERAELLGRIDKLDINTLRSIVSALPPEDPTFAGSAFQASPADRSADELEEHHRLDRITNRYTCGTQSNAAFVGKVQKHVNAKLRKLGYMELPSLSISHERSPESINSSGGLSFDRQSLPPVEVAKFLSDVYHEHCQTTAAFTDRMEISTRIDTLYEVDRTLTKEDASWLSVVLLVLSIGAGFSQRVENGMNSSEDIQGAANGADVASDLRVAAMGLLPDALAMANIDTAQVLLMLGHLQLSLCSPREACKYFSLCCSILKWKMMFCNEPDTRSRSRKLYLFASRWVARLSILHAQQHSSTFASLPGFPVSADGYAPDNNGIMSGLSGWLCNIHEALLQGCAEAPDARRLIGMLARYRQWWSALPISQMPPIQLNKGQSHLHLYHHVNLMVLGRPFILPSAPIGRSENRNEAAAEALSLAEVAEYSAYSVIEICSVLDRTHGLSYNSYVTVSTCHTAVMVMLARSLQGRCELYNEKLRLGMEHLKKLQDSTEHKALCAWSDATAQLQSARTSQQNVRGAQALPDTEGYSRFRSWINAAKSSAAVPSPASLQESTEVAVSPLWFDNLNWDFPTIPALEDMTLFGTPVVSQPFE